MAGSPPQAKVTNTGVLLWKPKTNNPEKFHLKATDECNVSSTFEMTIEIVACPCTGKGTCRPESNHPRGSGMYVCECQPGYEGQRCEKEINECLPAPCVHGEFETCWLLSICMRFLCKRTFRPDRHKSWALRSSVGSSPMYFLCFDPFSVYNDIPSCFSLLFFSTITSFKLIVTT